MNHMDTSVDNCKIKSKPELIAPAGDWSSLSSAVASGADAVYFGVKGLNMRHSARNFDILEMKKIMDLLHSKKRKGYLALNVMVRDSEMPKVRRVLEEAASSGVDAVILWDMAVLSLVTEHGLAAHLSTQASVSNFEALRKYAELGIKRAVLARECSLDEIRSIISSSRDSGIDCAVETFIHGAMCVSVSGRCFLSHETFSRSANRGDCLQPCRREYSIKDTDGECEYILGKDYVLSAKDLCTVMFIDELIRTGINAFKIEGRMRSPEYSGTVTAVYREAIDAFSENRLSPALKEDLLKRLKGTFNRGFTPGFFRGRPDDTGASPGKSYEKTYLGEVKKYYKKIGVAEVNVTARGINRGDCLLVSGAMTPAMFFTADGMQVDHEPVDKVSCGAAVGIKTPLPVRPADKVFYWGGPVLNDITDDVLEKWTKGLGSDKGRIAVFENIRDIPYYIDPAHFSSGKGPERMLSDGRGSCIPKHYLMGRLFSKLGYHVKYCLYPFKWRDQKLDYPQDVREASVKVPLTYHLACRVLLEDKWRLCDATWNPALERLGFPVDGAWDGKTDTALAVIPDGPEHGSRDIGEISDLLRRRLSAYSMEDKRFLSRFTVLFNRWVDHLRPDSQN